MYSAAELKEIFEQYVENERFVQKPQALYEPMNYLLGIGGKRLRPLLVLLCANIFDDEVNVALPAAYAIELFHNFSLIHDDIMDAAPLRRGQASVHNKYGTNTGILAGDALLIYAYKYLLKSDTSRILLINQCFTDIAIEVCEGQQLDMIFESQMAVTKQEYIQMIYQKTAALIAGSMKVGALLGGATEEQAELLYDYGKNLGIGFQLQDDILDAFGDTQKVGKKRGGDIVQQKKTILYILVSEQCDAAERSSFNQLYHDNSLGESRIDKVLTIFENKSVHERANQLQNSFRKKADELIKKLDVVDDRKARLQEFVHQLIKRDY